MFDFAGKTALVTGGGVGIGRATAEAFLAAGGRVAIIEKDEARAADAATALGPDALVIHGDVTEAATIEAARAAIDERFGGLDLLVNNVGDFLRAGRFERMKPDDIARIYATNLGQVFAVTHAMLPLLRVRAPGSSIVSVSSIEGFRGIPNCAVYSACKAGMMGFTKSLALDLGPSGIRVNLIAPETTDTPQVPVSTMVPEENREHVKSWIPLGRFGTPEDMANGILFLASPLAGWITGTSLHIDGGALAAGGWYRDMRGVWTNMPMLSGNGLNI